MINYSIIIPVYNGEKVIKRISEQILSCNSNDLELILVDDGSTDNTLSIINDIAESDNRVVAISQTNAGPSAARNHGIKKSNGKMIIFCDADDNIKTKNLIKTLQKFKDTKHDLVVLPWEITIKTKHGTVRHQINQSKQFILQNEIIEGTIKSIGDNGQMYNLWNKIYQAEIIRTNKLTLNEDLKFGEDLLFNFEYIKKAKSIFISDSKPYYIYEEDSPTSIVSETKLNYKYRIDNLRALENLNPKNDIQLSDYINFVKWRWMVSYILAVCKSNKSFINKYNLIKHAIKDQKLKPENNSKNLSPRKYSMEKTLYIMSFSPLFILISMTIVNKLKSYLKKKDKNILLPKI